MSRGNLLALLGNEWVAFAVSIFILFIIAIFSEGTWALLFSIMVSWVICDSLIGYFASGGRGVGQIPVSRSSHTQRQGYVYLSYLGGIIIITLVTSEVLQILTDNFTSVDLGSLFVLSMVAAGLVWLDFYLKFYKH